MNETKCPTFVHNGWIRWLVMVKAMDSQNRVLIIVFNVILVFSTLFLNSLSITAIRKSSQLKNKLCYFVILVQSSVDFSFGVISIPALIVFVASPLLGIENCFFIVALVQTVIIVPAISLATLSSMTLERYIGVLYPYSYQTFVTKRRLLIYLGVGCLILFGGVSSSIITPGILKPVTVVYVLANFLFIAFAYTRIYLVIRRLRRTRQCPVDTEKQKSGIRRLLREVQHAKSCFIVVLYFIVSLMPFVISSSFVNEKNFHKSAAIVSWAITLTNSNSSFNSLIFFWTKTLLRKEAVATLKSFL